MKELVHCDEYVKYSKFETLMLETICRSNLLHQVTSNCQSSNMISSRSKLPQLPHITIKPHQNNNTICTTPNQ
jgi:hypothetical protein